MNPFTREQRLKFREPGRQRRGLQSRATLCQTAFDAPSERLWIVQLNLIGAAGTPLWF
jgi:hypothetical protein